MEQEKEKLQKICAILRQEAIEPAQKEAEQWLAEAKKEAEEIIARAEKEAQKIVECAKQSAEKEKKMAEASLRHAVEQSVEWLRQTISSHLFNRAATEELSPLQCDPSAISRLIDAGIQAIENGGVTADIKAYLPRQISVEEVSKLLASRTLESLKKGKEIIPSSFSGGIKLCLVDKKITLDISEEALKELLFNYAHTSYRNFFFSAAER